MLQYACKMINLQNDSGAKYLFETNTICDFWLKVSDIYPNVGKEVLKNFLLFPSTYLCECGFFTPLHVKTKTRNRLNFTVQDDFRCALSKMQQRIDNFAENFTHKSIGVREGILLGGGRKKFALKITICPKNKQFALKLTFLVLTRIGPETYWKSVLYTVVEFVYNGFVCNVDSPITQYFVRSRWHLLHAFQFAYNVNSAITFFMQSPLEVPV